MKDTTNLVKYECNSSEDRSLGRLWVRSSAIIDPHFDLLGIHSEAILQPRRAANNLAALLIVVASSSEVDLPFTRADTAAMGSILKTTDVLTNLGGHPEASVRIGHR